MQYYRLKRAKTFGFFNFDPYTIFVCHLDHVNGRVMKGISLAGPNNGLAEIPIAMRQTDIDAFTKFLEEILAERLPRKIRVRGGAGSMFLNLRLTIRKVENQHSNTIFKGSCFLGSCLGGVWNRLAIRKQSVKNCLSSLRELNESAT